MGNRQRRVESIWENLIEWSVLLLNRIVLDSVTGKYSTDCGENWQSVFLRRLLAVYTCGVRGLGFKPALRVGKHIEIINEPENVVVFNAKPQALH